MSQLFAPFTDGAGFDRAILGTVDGRATFRAYCEAVAAVARCKGGNVGGVGIDEDLFCWNVAKACKLHDESFGGDSSVGLGGAPLSNADGNVVLDGNVGCGSRGVGGLRPVVASVSVDASVPRECGDDAVNVVLPKVRVPGKWAASNRRKKENRKNRGVPEWRRGAAPVGFCETVVSEGSAVTSCPSYGQALSDAEKEAKESLARRRAAENALKEKLAKLKLAELEDEKRCAEVADLKRQRIIQWTNEATAKSQQSVDKLKSIDPSSSASQYEIRQQAKKLADAEAEVRRVSSIVKTLSPDWQELLERKAESTFNTEYVDELMALGEAGRDNGFNY